MTSSTAVPETIRSLAAVAATSLTGGLGQDTFVFKDATAFHAHHHHQGFQRDRHGRPERHGRGGRRARYRRYHADRHAATGVEGACRTGVTLCYAAATIRFCRSTLEFCAGTAASLPDYRAAPERHRPVARRPVFYPHNDQYRRKLSSCPERDVFLRHVFGSCACRERLRQCIRHFFDRHRGRRNRRPGFFTLSR